MVEVRGSFVGHFLWTPYMDNLKDNNTKKTQMFGIKTRPIFPKF